MDLFKKNGALPFSAIFETINITHASYRSPATGSTAVEGMHR